MTSKVHIHDEQFDGHMHSWCGRGGNAVLPDVFEATAPDLRCSFCNREWFPGGQPDWHRKQAEERLKDREEAREQKQRDIALKYSTHLLGNKK